MTNISLSIQGAYILIYLILGLAALAVSWWSFRILVPHISHFKRILLLILRALGIFLIAVLLLEPLITHFSVKIIGNKLGIVFDKSSSMKIADQSVSRYSTALDILDKFPVKNVNLEYFGFADSVTALKSPPDSSAVDGRATDLAKAISEPMKIAPDDLGALLVVTDGAGNIGPDPLAMAATIDIPVYSLVVGKSISFKDVAITDIEYPPVSYINTEFTAGVVISASGYGGEQAVVEIRDGKNVIGSKKVVLPSDGAFEKINFNLKFSDEGVKNLQAVIGRLEGEEYDNNNTRSFPIKLLKDKINILILSSSINWELTFLKRALLSDTHFKVQTAISGNNRLIPTADLPSTLENWKLVDLIIAIDLGKQSVGSQINNLIAAVESGTGFLFIAGNSTRLKPLGGWDDILPIRSTSRSSIVEGEFFPVPGSQAIAKSITNIEGLDWNKLNPLQFRIDNLEIAPNSIIFLSTVGNNDEINPILIGGKFKTGKTAAIIGYPWWTRYFRPGSGNQTGKGMEKFWSNLVRWLVAREDLEKFELKPDKSVYKLGEPVGFTATLFDDSYNLISGAKIDLEIVDSSGTKREFQLTGIQPGRYSGIFGSPAAGNYAFNSYAIVDGDTVGKSSGRFTIESFGLEMENPSANYSIMSQIGSITGGKSYNADDFSQFNQDLKLDIKSADVFKEYQLTGNLYVLLIIIALFGLEWGIRKFSQLP